MALCVGVVFGWAMFLRSAEAFGEGGQAIAFMGWEQELSGEVLRRFAVVGVIYNSSYLGGVVGLVVALLNQRKHRHLMSVSNTFCGD